MKRLRRRLFTGLAVVSLTLVTMTAASLMMGQWRTISLFATLAGNDYSVTIYRNGIEFDCDWDTGKPTHHPIANIWAPSNDTLWPPLISRPEILAVQLPYWLALIPLV